MSSTSVEPIHSKASLETVSDKLSDTDDNDHSVSPYVSSIDEKF